MWNSYNIATFIVNVFIAIGTIGAVLIALGFFNIKEKLTGNIRFIIPTKDSISSKQPIYKADFHIFNNGTHDSIFNYNAGIVLKTKNSCEIISLNNTQENATFIPRKGNQSFSYTLNLVNDRVPNMLKDKDCKILVFSMAGAEISLKRDI